MKFIKSHIYQLILLLLIILIFLTNYQKDTFLIGWDNFNSELNPSLAITQAINAAWSDFRSFGLVAGLAYATNLWHAIFVWISSFILPQNIIRYFFHCLMLLTGALGIFSFFKYIKLSPFTSFIGGLSYILNFGTIQIFGLPYEPFSILFALLPWALLSWFRLIKKVNRKNLINFFIANLLLTGAFYVQTLFVVYCLTLLLINLLFIIQHKSNFLPLLKTSALIWILLAITNSYWLFSQIYFLANNVEVVRTAKQTLLGWGTPYFQNKSHSNLFAFFTQTGFYTDFTNSTGLSFFQTWLNYQQQPLILLSLIIYIFLTIVGIVDGKHKYKKYFLALLCLTVVSLLMTLPLIGVLNNLIRQIPTIDQIFRAPFSKFTAIQSLILSFFFCLGIDSIYSRLTRFTHKKLLLTLPILIIILINFPVFTNHFFVHEVKQSIPQEYFQLSEFFDTQAPNSRIALFPETNIWGWYDYNWGYTGSGFLWHFIRQPIVSRSYDVWSKYSENYFWEISHALDSRNNLTIMDTLTKYHISYLLIDQSLSNGSGKTRTKQLDILNNFVLNNLSPNDLVFQSKNISVYKLNNFSQFSALSNLSNIGPNTNRPYMNNLFSTYTNYQTNPLRQFDRYYPFIDLQTQTHNSKQLWYISENNNYFTITTTLPDSLPNDLTLIEPIPNDRLPINININDNQLMASFPKVVEEFNNYTSVYDCSSSEAYQKTDSDIVANLDQTSFNISVKKDSKACWSYHYDDISGNDGHLLSINPSQIIGPPPILSLDGHTTRNTLSKQQISTPAQKYYIIPPTSSQDRGISAHFELQSYLQSDSFFYSQTPHLYLFPQQTLSQIYFTSQNPTISSQSVPLTSTQISPYLHKVKISTQQNQYLIFSQSFDKGWLAFYLNGFKPVFLKDHTLINNWANGWNIENLGSQSIYILFWPQLLQFLGFFLLISTTVYILRRKTSQDILQHP